MTAPVNSYCGLTINRHRSRNGFRYSGTGSLPILGYRFSMVIRMPRNGTGFGTFNKNLAILPLRWGSSSLVLNINEIMRQVRKALRSRGFNTVPPDVVVHVPSYEWGWRRRGEPLPWAVADLLLEIGTTRGTARLCYNIEHMSCRTGPQN